MDLHAGNFLGLVRQCMAQAFLPVKVAGLANFVQQAHPGTPRTEHLPCTEVASETPFSPRRIFWTAVQADRGRTENGLKTDQKRTEKRTKNGPKMARNPRSGHFWSISLCPFWVRFWSVFGPFSVRFGSVFDPFSVRFSPADFPPSAHGVPFQPGSPRKVLKSGLEGRC